MTLSNGTKLGPYEILSPLGAGGMGEVYRATDSKLDRQVAIKVLPEVMTRDPERVARFQREAKVLASLNHPNIAAIYGFETVNAPRTAGFSLREASKAKDATIPASSRGESADEDATTPPSSRKLKHAAQELHFLVMELVEGETLAQRLKRGAFTVEETLDIAKQIAEALEAAHEQGVIHRDLKPANVMVRPDGTIRVLDFGLAKAMATVDERHQTEFANSPTITLAHSPTAPGIILGTAAYMSPEQARGKPLDKRTDIWSFGVVVLECLTGRTMFGGETISDSIGAILHKEPDWDSLPPNTPPTVHLLLRRCLSKNASKRLRDIGDARIEIENAIVDPTSSSLGIALADAMSRDGSARRIVVSAVIFGIVVALLAGVSGWHLKSDPQSFVRKFDMGIRDYEPGQGIAISPDGRKIVYSSNRRLWVREMDKLEPRELAETDHAAQPIWSPDSSRIAYATENKLWHIAWQGGSPTAVGTLPTAMLPVGGLSWTEDDRIMIATGNTGLHEVSARGGEVRTLLNVDPTTEEDYHHAAALPESRGILFTVHKKGGGSDAIDLWTPEGRKTLLEIPGERFENPVYSQTGHIIYSRSTTTPGLWALPFSLTTLEVQGDPFLIVSDGARPAVSRDGTLVYFRGTISLEHRMIWVDRSGKALETVGQPQRGLENPRISPDGTRIAVNATEPDSRNIWIHDIERRTKMRLTFDQITPSTPLWIHGRDQIVYSTGAGNRGPAWIKNADGSGQAHELPIVSPTSSSYDGKFLLYHHLVVNGSEGIRSDDIGYLPMDGEGKPTPFIESGVEDRSAVFSPDGTLVAYEHRDSSSEEIFLTTFPDGNGRWQVSVKSGAIPRWSSKGDEIFYIEVATFSLMSVSVEREPTLTLGTPKKLFFGSTPGVALYAGYDVAQDAQRFLMVQINDPTSAKQGIAIVENWIEEFKHSR
jgi:serine/threonine protein kinase